MEKESWACLVERRGELHGPCFVGCCPFYHFLSLKARDGVPLIKIQYFVQVGSYLGRVSFQGFIWDDGTGREILGMIFETGRDKRIPVKKLKTEIFWIC